MKENSIKISSARSKLIPLFWGFFGHAQMKNYQAKSWSFLLWNTNEWRASHFQSETNVGNWNKQGQWDKFARIRYVSASVLKQYPCKLNAQKSTQKVLKVGIRLYYLRFFMPQKWSHSSSSHSNPPTYKHTEISLQAL